MQDWKTESRRRVDEALGRASYLCPRGKEWKVELSDESKDALRQAAAEMETGIQKEGEE